MITSKAPWRVAALAQSSDTRATTAHAAREAPPPWTAQATRLAWSVLRVEERLVLGSEPSHAGGAGGAREIPRESHS